MERGTGVDLWWGVDWDCGLPYLAEVKQRVNGVQQGFEWWLNPDHTVWVESHWHRGERHGIQRSWGERETPHRGYPKYFVLDEEVSEEVYLQAAASDPTLPPFREADQSPDRDFPREVRAALRAPFTYDDEERLVMLPWEEGE